MPYHCTNCGENHKTGEICQVARLDNFLPIDNRNSHPRRLVLVDDEVQIVVASCKDEVCVLNKFDYADGFSRQLTRWTKDYLNVIYDDGNIVMVEPPKKK